MHDILEIDEASEAIGVPVAQLLRWAYLRCGPPNLGTRSKPKYNVHDLNEWSDGRTKTAPSP